MKWVEEKTYCNGEINLNVFYNRLCAIPMSVLQTEPYNLI